MVELITPPESAGLTKYGLSKAASTGRFLMTAAMALDVAKLKRSEEATTPEVEARLCMDSLDRYLGERGLGRGDILKITAYISSTEYFDEVLAAIRSYFEPGKAPVVCPVSAKLAGECRVELDIVAAEKIAS